MIEKLIKIDPDQRIQIGKLKQHPFVSQTAEQYREYLVKIDKQQETKTVSKDQQQVGQIEESKISSSGSGDQATIEDLEEAVQDTRACVALTSERLKNVLRLFQVISS